MEAKNPVTGEATQDEGAHKAPESERINFTAIVAEVAREYRLPATQLYFYELVLTKIIGENASTATLSELNQLVLSGTIPSPTVVERLRYKVQETGADTTPQADPIEITVI